MLIGLGALNRGQKQQVIDVVPRPRPLSISPTSAAFRQRDESLLSPLSLYHTDGTNSHTMLDTHSLSHSRSLNSPSSEDASATFPRWMAHSTDAITAPTSGPPSAGFNLVERGLPTYTSTRPMLAQHRHWSQERLDSPTSSSSTSLSLPLSISERAVVPPSVIGSGRVSKKASFNEASSEEGGHSVSVASVSSSSGSASGSGSSVGVGSGNIWAVGGPKGGNAQQQDNGRTGSSWPVFS